MSPTSKEPLLKRRWIRADGSEQQRLELNWLHSRPNTFHRVSFGVRWRDGWIYRIIPILAGFRIQYAWNEPVCWSRPYLKDKVFVASAGGPHAKALPQSFFHESLWSQHNGSYEWGWQCTLSDSLHTPKLLWCSTCLHILCDMWRRWRSGERKKGARQSSSDFLFTPLHTWLIFCVKWVWLSGSGSFLKLPQKGVGGAGVRQSDDPKISGCERNGNL